MMIQVPPPHPQPLLLPNPKSLLPQKPPQVLTLRNPPSTFREKLNYLQNTLHLDPHQTLTQNPSLRTFPLSSLQSLSSLLSSFGISPPLSSRIFRMYPHLLTTPPSHSLLPILQFLLGPAQIPPPLLPKSLLRCPRLLSSSLPLTLLPSLAFLRSLGFSSFSPNTALLLVLDVNRTLSPKLQFIRSLGFSRRKAVTMVLRSPAIFTFSVEGNMRRKVEYLEGEMGRSVGEVGRFPHYFSFSLERRIMVRYGMMREVGVEREMGLEEMLTTSDGEFRESLLRWKLRKVGEDI